MTRDWVPICLVCDGAAVVPTRAEAERWVEEHCRATGHTSWRVVPIDQPTEGRE
jgi:hypothetical protein